MAEAAETDTEKKKLSPQATIEEVGPCKLKVRVEVGADKVKERIDDKYLELSESVALPGFRKGHAPRNLLERKFGKALLEDLKFELLSHSFDEVKEEKKLEPVGEPDVDAEKLSVEEGKPFAYELTLEVRPTFEVGTYEGIKVRQPPIAVAGPEVDKVLVNFQEARAELVPVPDGIARAEDQIIADFALSVEGKGIDTAENNAVFLNADITFYGIALPDYHKSVAGHKVGESVESTVRLPDDFGDKAYAGKDAVLRTTIKGVKRKKLPEVDAEFLKAFDMDTVEELREHIRKRIEREKDAQRRALMADRIVDHLIKETDFPMPEGLIDAGNEEALRRVHLDLTFKGVAEEEIARAIEKEKAGSRESMAKALRAHFILEQIAKKEKIFVTEDQVEERISQLAAQAGKWPHEMKAYLEEHGLATQLRRRMREELVREYLLSKAVIEEEK